MVEIACEPTNNCNTDQLSFKAYLARWMAASTKLAPFVEPLVSNYLQTSAKAAAAACTGGEGGVSCGTKWNAGSYDGKTGVRQHMSALEVVQGLLIDDVSGPKSETTGGTSKGDPGAGTGQKHGPSAEPTPITMSDRAGAGILTAMILSGIVGGAWYVGRGGHVGCKRHWLMRLGGYSGLIRPCLRNPFSTSTDFSRPTFRQIPCAKIVALPCTFEVRDCLTVTSVQIQLLFRDKPHSLWRVWTKHAETMLRLARPISPSLDQRGTLV